MRTSESMRVDAAKAGLAVQHRLQGQLGRGFDKERHFKITPEEFIQYHADMTVSTNIGWYLMYNVPVWVD